MEWGNSQREKEKKKTHTHNQNENPLNAAHSSQLYATYKKIENNSIKSLSEMARICSPYFAKCAVFIFICNVRRPHFLIRTCKKNALLYNFYGAHF